MTLYLNPEIVTVLVEIPHSGFTDKLNRKGLGGHSAIIIGDEFYDYGPQPNEPFYSKGRPWWDKAVKSGNLTKDDIFTILNNDDLRERIDAVGVIHLIDIEVSRREKIALEKWWINKYKNPGTYSVIPGVGEQCTTNVRKSLEMTTRVFDIFSTGAITPEGLYDLLMSSGRNTYGKNKGKRLIDKKYDEI